MSLYVRDLAGNEYPLQATITNEGELNGNQSVSATIYASRVNKAFINDITEMWEIVDFEEVTHKIIFAKKKGEGNSLTVEIKAIPLFFDTFDTLRIYEEYNEHMTAALAFTRIFVDTPFNFVLVDGFEAVQWEGFGGGESRLETFKRALERYQAEFRIEGNTVYLHKQIGRDTQFQYRYRLNASNITQENDASAMWTYAKGYGDYGDGEGGEDWQNAKLIREYTSPLAQIPGISIRHAPPIKNGNIKVTSAMDGALKELVDESLKISVSADIHDLRKQGYPIAQSELGDRVFLIDERIGLNDEVRVVDIKITRNWKGEVVDLSLTFGSEGITKRHQSNLQTAIKDITDIVAGRRKLPFSVLDNAVIAATNALKSALTELIFDNGIIAVDKNDPNNIVLFNSNGLGISRDGGQTFEDAITYLGVNTKLLTAGQIFTNNIAIIGESDYFFWDGNALQAYDPNDSTRYVKLNSRGIDVKKGLIEVERADGFKTIIGGRLNVDFGVQGSVPSFLVNATIAGRYFRTTQAVSNGGAQCDLFTFSRVARYLKIELALARESGTSATAYASVLQSGGSTVLASASSTEDAGFEEIRTLTIDLGTPTGNTFAIVLRLAANNENMPVYCRVNRIYQTDK